jgi:hypothetical protein
MGTQIATITGGKAGYWKEIDITNFINKNAGNIVSIGIYSTGSDGLDFYSKEASSANRPYIQIK